LPHTGESKEFFSTHHGILRPGFIFDFAIEIIDLKVGVRYVVCSR
jgi:hypothetical protein